MPIRLRQEQMDAFSADLEARFVRRMVRHLAEDFPRGLERHGVEEPEVEPLVRRGLSDARRYGVVNQGDLKRYIELLALLGPRFDADRKYPWAGMILRRDDIDGEAKMDRITEHLIFDTEAGL